jgi:DNA invertase Pin-like site-specific DNA recombinase
VNPGGILGGSSGPALGLQSGHGIPGAEPHLATDNELVRNILLALLASLAKVEAQKISERTKAGMARARAKGKRIGRPAIDTQLRQQLVARVAEVGAYVPLKNLAWIEGLQ